MRAEAVQVRYDGDGVWVAVLDQDAMENIAHYLPIAATRTTSSAALIDLADRFKAALEMAFPDDSQDPA